MSFSALPTLAPLLPQGKSPLEIREMVRGVEAVLLTVNASMKVYTSRYRTNGPTSCGE